MYRENLSSKRGKNRKSGDQLLFFIVGAWDSWFLIWERVPPHPAPGEGKRGVSNRDGRKVARSLLLCLYSGRAPKLQLGLVAGAVDGIDGAGGWITKFNYCYRCVSERTSIRCTPARCCSCTSRYKIILFVTRSKEGDRVTGRTYVRSLYCWCFFFSVPTYHHTINVNNRYLRRPR